MCNHQNAKCVESTDVKDEGRFREKYRCTCGATGVITGNEQDPPSSWNKSGRVFN